MMNSVTQRRWRLAFSGLWRLGRNHGDLGAVMDIIQSLEGRAIWTAYRRMQHSLAGRGQLLRQRELSELLMDRAWLDGFAPGTLGAAYRSFIGGRPFSARTLADQLKAGPNGATIRKGGPVPWFARRVADLHDVAHVLTGYDADPQGEGCLMGWTFAQLGAFGYAAIAIGSALIFGIGPVLEGYRLGRRAAWLFDLDVEAAFALPLDQVRARLGVTRPRLYRGRRQLA